VSQLGLHETEIMWKRQESVKGAASLFAASDEKRKKTNSMMGDEGEEEKPKKKATCRSREVEEGNM